MHTRSLTDTLGTHTHANTDAHTQTRTLTHSLTHRHTHTHTDTHPLTPGVGVVGSRVMLTRKSFARPPSAPPAPGRGVNVRVADVKKLITPALPQLADRGDGDGGTAAEQGG